MTATALTTEEAEAVMREAVRRSSILDSVPIISPAWQRPTHMEPLARVLRRMHKAACGEGPPVFACLSAPPQVGKTELVLHALAWWLARNPEHFLGFVSYGSDLAETKSRRVRDLARHVGVELRTDSRAVDLWNTTAGGGLLARGLAAGITGQSALSAIIVDDPYKNRVEAESRAYRSRVLDDFRSTILSRRGPRTSVLVLHTRWHEDDLIGVLSRDGWERHVIKAIDDEGQPLWAESGRDLAFWETTRENAGEHAWWSLYMGEPRPREGRLFSGVHYYDALPAHYSVAIGCDFAYSTRSQADYSTAVAVGYDAAREQCFVLDVLREQVPSPVFAQTLKAWASRWPGARLHAYIGGTERGTVDFFRAQGVHVNALPAGADKFVRAQGASAVWNRGACLVPREGRWVEAFVGELLDFPGAHDDQVDAFVAAVDHVPRALSVALPRLEAPPRRYDAPPSSPSPLAERVRRRWE